MECVSTAADDQGGVAGAGQMVGVFSVLDEIHRLRCWTDIEIQVHGVCCLGSSCCGVALPPHLNKRAAVAQGEQADMVQCNVRRARKDRRLPRDRLITTPTTT